MADTRTFKPAKRKPISVAVTYVRPTRAMRQADHREKMRRKKDERREIARRLAKIGGAS